MTESVLTHG